MYDPHTGNTELAADGLNFPNGVQMTPDQTGVIISESNLARLVRYDVNDGTVGVWADSLPGLVDNIRYSQDTGWVYRRYRPTGNSRL